MTFSHGLSLLCSHELLLGCGWRQAWTLTVRLTTFGEPFLHDKAAFFSSLNVTTTIVLAVSLVSWVASWYKQRLTGFASHCALWVLFSISIKMSFGITMISQLACSCLHWRWDLSRLLSNAVLWRKISSGHYTLLCRLWNLTTTCSMRSMICCESIHWIDVLLLSLAASWVQGSGWTFLSYQVTN